MHTLFARTVRLLLCVALAAGLSACGTEHSKGTLVPRSNSGPPVPNPTPPPPPFPPAEATSFPSIQLVPWCAECVDASGAVVTIDGEPAAVTDLREGEIVVQSGSRTIRNYGDGIYRWKVGDTAPPVVDRIDATTLLQGPVASVDPQTGALIVMGQQVQFLRTAIDSIDPVEPANLQQFAAGDMVRVSGYRAVDDRILATRIDTADVNTPVRITGRLTPGDSYFRVGSLDIDATNVVVGEELGLLAGGEAVSVTGTLDTASGVLIATTLRAYDPLGIPEDGALVTAAGFAAGYTEYEFPPHGEVEFANLIFEDRSCEYDAGFDWKLNQAWQLEGVSNGDSTVRVTCYLGHSPFDERDYSPVAKGVSGPVDAVDLDRQTVSVVGVEVRLNFATRLGYSRYVPTIWDFTYEVAPLSERLIGHLVQVSGFSGPDTSVIFADTIAAESYEPETDWLKLFGTPDSLDAPDIVLNGRTIPTGAATLFLDLSASGCRVLAAEEYFDAGLLPTTVLLDVVGDELTAREVWLHGQDPQASRWDCAD